MSAAVKTLYNPFRTVLKKEWQQSAVLRGVAVAMMILVTPFALLVAEAASRGWVPMFRISSYNRTDLIMEMVPMLIAAAWLFFALMACASAFASDRSTGKESFLLERPVSRVTIWKARLVATVLNSLMIMVSGWIVWAGFSLMLAEPVEGIFLQASSVLLSVGGVLVVMVICGGLASSAMIDSPMLAFLGGGLLAAAPFGAGVFLAGVSPFAIVFTPDFGALPAPLLLLSQLPIGMILPVLLFPVFVIASYQVLCKGEPAGRGRRQRGGKVLVPAVVGVFVLFLILAPLAVRAHVDHDLQFRRLVSAPVAGRTIATSGYMKGGWLLDTANGKKIRFLPGPTTDLVWRGDGKYLAVVGEGKTFYWPWMSLSPLKIVDGETGKDLVELDTSSRYGYEAIVWIGGKLLLVLSDLEKWNPEIPFEDDGSIFHYYLAEEGSIGWEDGHIREITILLPKNKGTKDFWKVISLGPSPEQVYYIHAPPLEDLLQNQLPENEWKTSIGRLAIVGDSIRVEPVGLVPGYPYMVESYLSPSCRYSWIVNRGRIAREGKAAIQRNLRLLDVGSGEEILLQNTQGVGWPVWMIDDELLWVQIFEERAVLHRWEPGEGQSVLMETAKGERLAMDRSPDRKKVLLSVYRRDESTEDEKTIWEGTSVYKAGSGKVELSKLAFMGSAAGAFYTTWADPETILWGDGDRIYLERIDHPGEPVELN